MINVQKLTKYYGSTCALKDVSFEVDQGEILGLLGPNGAGKTTTLRILTCYLRPTEGTIKVKEHDVLQNPLAVKQMIGYFPETAPLYPDMLVFDYLLYIAEMRQIEPGKRIDRLKLLCDLCGLEAVMHRPISEISKGYKQRVGLAHAMMKDPEILVLDEPTAGLDPNQIVEIRSIIKEIGRTKTVILSTHILTEAEATCDRVVIINEGQVAADGSLEKLRERRSGNVDISISLAEAEADDVRARLSSVQGVGHISIGDEAENAEENVVHAHLSCSNDIRAEIYRRIKQQDWILLEFTPERKSLESIFRDLTRGEKQSLSGTKVKES